MKNLLERLVAALATPHVLELVAAAAIVLAVGVGHGAEGSVCDWHGHSWCWQ